MCTMIAEKRTIEGFGKRGDAWIKVDRAYVTYDHAVHLAVEHALNIDFVRAEGAVGERVAVELTRESARALMAAIEAALARAEGVD